MDFADTPELSAFRNDARAWLEHNVPRSEAARRGLAMFAEQPDEQAYLDRARLWQALLAEAGWTGITWPTEYGGRGLSPLHEVVWAQESAGFDLPVGVFGIGLGMGGPTVMAWGSEEQKRRWLRPMLRGEEIWCQLFSEPGAGSDVAGVVTRAERDGDDWVVNGQKVWTSGAQYSRWGMLLARTNPSVPKHSGLTYFIIDMDQPGVEVRPLRQMTGGANFNEVFFADARVPDVYVLGGEGLGWTVATTTLMNERLSIGRVLIGSTGVFESVRALFAALDAAGRGDAVHRRALVDLFVRGEVLRYMTQRLVTKFARGEIPSAEGSAAKLGLTQMLEELGNLVVDAQGAGGMLDGSDSVDHGDWALTFLSYPGLKVAGGTDEVMKNLIAERVLGLPAEPRLDKNMPFADLIG